jgi:uncharacterized membrane protein YphA (DoxX/SURF4 family)
MIERWNRWWFPQSDGLDLAVCRILAVGSLLFVFLPFFMTSPAEHIALIDRPGGFVHPQWMIRLAAALVPADSPAWPHLVHGAFAIAIGAGATTLIGLRTRTSAALLALAIWFLVSHDGSYGEIHHPDIVLSLFLLFLALSPSGRRLSIDALLRGRAKGTTDRAVWPLKLTRVLLAWTYFSNAAAKLLYSGLDWMNGYTLQQSMLYSSLQWERPLGFRLAQHHDLCVALSVATLAFELLFPLALFVPRSRPALLLTGAVFHLALYFTMNIGFFQNVILYAVFADFGDLGIRLRGLLRGEPRHDVRMEI